MKIWKNKQFDKKDKIIASMEEENPKALFWKIFRHAALDFMIIAVGYA